MPKTTNAMTTNLPPWLEKLVADGLQLMKQLHDQLPPNVQKVTAQIPGEMIIASLIVIILFNILLFLCSVKVRGMDWSQQSPFTQ